MSWFSQGLSNLSGQLTTITRDILNEGTEEVEDPETSLRLAQNKISELENQISSQQHEIQRLLAINEELQVKSDSSEIQINHLNEKYREQLAEKQQELDYLSCQLHQRARGEPEGESTGLSTNQNSQSIDKNSDKNRLRSESSDNYFENDDSFDFASEETFQPNSYHDLVQQNHFLQQQIKQLNADLKNNKSQRLLNNVGNAPSCKDDSASNNHLQELESLRHELSRKEEYHHAQMEALQEDHKRRINDLKRAHREQMEELDDQMQLLRTEMNDRLQSKDNESPHVVSVDVGTDCPQTDYHNQFEQRNEVIENLQQEIARLTQQQTTHEGENLLPSCIPANSCDVSTQFSHEELSPTNTGNFTFRNNHLKSLNFDKSPSNVDACDSQSQLSDVSEISLLSRQLDDHVILLSNQMKQYEEEMKRAMGDGSNVETAVREKLIKKQESLSRLLKKQEALRSKRKTVINIPIEESLVELSDREHSPTPKLEERVPMYSTQKNISSNNDWEESEDSETELTENSQAALKSSKHDDIQRNGPSPKLNSALNERIEELEKMLANKHEEISSFHQLILVIDEATALLYDRQNKITENLTPSDRIRLLSRELSNLSVKCQSLQDELLQQNVVRQHYEQLVDAIRQYVELADEESVQQWSACITRQFQSMIQQTHDDKVKITENQEKLEQLEASLVECRSNVSALDVENQQLQEIITSMKESLREKAEIENELREKLKESTDTLNLTEHARENEMKEVESLKILLKESESVLNDNESLRHQISHLQQEVDNLKSFNNVESVQKQASHEDEDRIRDLQAKVKSLKEELIAEHSKFNDLKHRLTEIQNEKQVELQKFEEERDGFEVTIIELQAKIDSLERSALNSKQSIVIDNESPTLEEKLKILMEEQLHLQNSLNESHKENESLNHLLNTTKQENVNLKSEVERLIKTLSSQGEVLSELNEHKEHLEKSLEEMSQSQSSSSSLRRGEDEDDSMSKEAIKNLSALIREKEFEIDSLKQKNDSLLEMIREIGGPEVPVDSVPASGPALANNPQETSAMQKLLQERENLARQIKAFQQDREQLIAALNQKHHESLSYHNEIQRLVAYIQNEKPKWESVDKELRETQHALNEKKNELIVCQRELQNLRQHHNQLSITLESLQQREDDSPDARDNNSELKEKLLAKEQTCHDLQTQISSMKQVEQSQCSELTSLKKQLERLSFQSSESHLQITELSNSENALKNRVKQQEETIELLRSQLQQITLSSSTVATAESSSADSNVIKERDQLALALSQSREEIHSLKSKLSLLEDRETKLLNEISRLRDHLMKIEEGYTQEALEAESRESSLRERIRNLEESASSSMLSVEHTLQEQKQMLDNVTAQLHSVTRERDITLERLSRCQNDLQQQIVSVTNLQTVLDNFQRDQESTIATETERYLKEVSRLKTEIASVRNENNELANQLKAQSDVIEAAHRLSEQLDKKEAAMLRMQELNNEKEQLMDDLKSEIRRLNNSSESKIDKELMKNLLIGYFHTPSHMKRDALRVIGNLLQFSDEQFEKIGIDVSNKSGWFSWLKKPLSNANRPLNSQEKSFTELFVSFLDRESRPKIPLKIPTEELVAEVASRKRTSSQSSSTSHSSHQHGDPPMHSTPIRPSDESHSAALLVNWSSPVTTSASNSSTITSSAGLSGAGKNPLLYILQDKS